MTYPLRAAHASFLNNTLGTPPRIPLSGAHESDVRIREGYIRAVTVAYLKFMEALTSDLNENLPVGKQGKVNFATFLREFTENAQANLYEPMGEALHVVERNREG